MEKSFEDICFEFQQKIVETFNEEKNISFLMKYYLMKEIWDNIQENKLKIDMQVRENHLPKAQVINLADDVDNEEKNENDLKEDEIAE